MNCKPISEVTSDEMLKFMRIKKEPDRITATLPIFAIVEKYWEVQHLGDINVPILLNMAGGNEQALSQIAINKIKKSFFKNKIKRKNEVQDKRWV